MAAVNSINGHRTRPRNTTERVKMATTKEMLDEAELAKSYIAASDISDDQKRTYLRLINITTEATNGISPEQKIQKMTEAILLLAASQAKYIISMDEKIDRAVAKANRAQCRDCKAMKHVEEVEEQKKHEELIEEWKRANGYLDRPDGADRAKTWSDTVKTALTKPYIYIVIALSMLSPYGVQIIDRLLQIYGK